jgi:hypothetical protein
MASAVERPIDRSSEEEKTIGEEHVETAKHVHTIENLPDPDAGLSEEERAAHVSHLHTEPKHRTMTILTQHPPGQSPPPQTRRPTNSLALLPLPHFLSRSHEHWQRQSRWPTRRSQHD